MKFGLIETEKANFPVLLMCRVLEVTRSGFYAWQGRPPSKRKLEDRRLAPAVEAAFLNSGKRYGSPRVREELNKGGEPISRRQTCRLMRELELVARAKKKFVATTMSEHDNPIAPNLLRRDFEAARPHQKLVGDITYLPTAQGFIYLAILLDLYSRRVVGYAVGATLETSLALDALNMAISTRALNADTIHHTDRGVQYTSAEYVERLKAKCIVQSMSRQGNCWDNAPAESFFSTLKFEVGELLNGKVAPRDVREAILDYIAFYNLKRMHSSIGYLCPAEFEQNAVMRAA